VSGSLETWLENVLVARNIASGEMMAGRYCAVVLFDAATPTML